jgi:hypothetical protein
LHSLETGLEGFEEARKPPGKGCNVYLPHTVQSSAERIL